MIIIIILKFYLGIDSKPYIFKSCVRLIIDPSQYKDKNYYYHNLKLNEGVNWGKVYAMGLDGQPRLTQINIKIKMIIIIILKLDSR